MVSLFENKLNSLPPNIVNQYPQLGNFKLDDFSGLSNISSNLGQPNFPVVNTGADIVQPLNEVQVPLQVPESIPIPNPAPAVVEIKEETPSEKLEKLIIANPELEPLQKSFKVGIPSHQVTHKGILNGIDKNLVVKFVELYLSANPSAK